MTTRMMMVVLVQYPSDGPLVLCMTGDYSTLLDPQDIKLPPESPRFGYLAIRTNK